MASQLEIRLLNIYKVDVQRIDTGCRIEGFSCESFMFLDYDKAMDFAFNLAREYSVGCESMPQGYEDVNIIDIEKLAKSESYIWTDKNYGCWDEYVLVYKSVLEFGNDIINKTRFSG